MVVMESLGEGFKVCLITLLTKKHFCNAILRHLMTQLRHLTFLLKSNNRKCLPLNFQDDFYNKASTALGLTRNTILMQWVARLLQKLVYLLIGLVMAWAKFE